MLNFSPHFLQVSDNRQYVYYEQSRDGTYETQDRTYLRIEDCDQSRHQEYSEVKWVKNAVSDFFVFEE